MHPGSARRQRSNPEWIAGLRGEGDDATTLQAELRSYVRGGLRRALGNALDDAELDDMTQDALLRIVDRLDQFRGDSRFTTWVMAVAIRTAYAALRRRRWGDCSLEEVIGEPSHEASAKTEVGHDDLVRTLREAIDRDLTPRQRAAVLGELAGIPTTVLAEQLETTPNALYKLHHDARRKLRAALEDRGFTAVDLRVIA